MGAPGSRQQGFNRHKFRAARNADSIRPSCLRSARPLQRRRPRRSSLNSSNSRKRSHRLRSCEGVRPTTADRSTLLHHVPSLARDFRTQAERKAAGYAPMKEFSLPRLLRTNPVSPRANKARAAGGSGVGGMKDTVMSPMIGFPPSVRGSRSIEVMF